jgi:DNA-binding transcriptional LysR family regulator
VELRHLRYFVAVADELNFRRAAERLHISQPPLSQQIRALERELGVQLLVRNRRRVELTHAGEAFLREAREILAAAEHAAESARRAARGEIGQLAVGFVGSAMYGALPEILRNYRMHHPNVELRLRELQTAPQLRALRAGELDVGVIRPSAARRETDLEIVTIQYDQVVAAIPEAHPLAASEAITPAELEDEPLVLLARRDAPGVHESLDSALAANGKAPNVIQEVPEIQTVIGLVAAGLGISLVPDTVGRVERPGVAYRPLAGTSSVFELALAWRASETSPVLEGFLAVVRSVTGTP